jgi:prepilin-type N-terminal cleavage/methylation domain-containing protein
MAYDACVKQRRDRGFSLLEVLIVVAIVMIMATVAFPAISSYIRNYKIKAAAQQVAGGAQAARSKAIMTNTNAGVSFVTVDVDSYRWIHEDLAPAEQLGPLQDLPSGIQFEASGTANAGAWVRFHRLGGFCNPAAGAPCAPAGAVVCVGPDLALRCNVNPQGPFIGTEAGGGMAITLLEPNTGLRRRVRIAPGGRVLVQEGQP